MAMFNSIFYVSQRVAILRSPAIRVPASESERKMAPSSKGWPGSLISCTKSPDTAQQLSKIRSLPWKMDHQQWCLMLTNGNINDKWWEYKWQMMVNINIIKITYTVMLTINLWEYKWQMMFDGWWLMGWWSMDWFKGKDHGVFTKV